MFNKVSDSIYLKRGAMFGLDARIALAIFGALSVISGAALYSAIQQAKVTSFVSDLNEIGKAWESYYLDTGQYPPYIATSAGNWTDETQQAVELVSSSVSNWKGPYLPYSIDTHLSHGQYYQIFLPVIKDSATWGDTVNWYPTGVCSSGDSDCYIWAHISGIESDSFMKAVDNEVDNGDGAQNGNFRWRNVGGAHKWGSYFKIAPIKR